MIAIFVDGFLKTNKWVHYVASNGLEFCSSPALYQLWSSTERSLATEKGKKQTNFAKLGALSSKQAKAIDWSPVAGCYSSQLQCRGCLPQQCSDLHNPNSQFRISPP